ncbi:hypothetical protein ACJ41P_26400 [Azospirillum argentinense]|uniref:Major capsid protein E n=1 Tax=Azospirillum argentinense TaxID=2970906 RepID=A0ABW8VEA6_9PROT
MAPPLNTASARVVDPILSHHVQGYRQQTLVGELLFPRVPVAVSGGKVLQFGKEAFMLYNAARAPGAATKRVQFGYEGKPYALEQERLEGKVPREWMRDASAVPGIDLGQRAVNGVMKILTLALEFQQSRIARDPDNYDDNHKLALSGGDKWSSDTGKPVTDISDGKEGVRSTIGVEPNVCILSPSAWGAAKENPQVLERRKYVEKGPVTVAEFAALIEVDHVMIGKAIYHNGLEFQDVWGNDCVLAYAPQTPSGMEEPSYGYTYLMEGNPLVETPYYENNPASWFYPTTFERAPVLTGESAGFLIQNCK